MAQTIGPVSSGSSPQPTPDESPFVHNSVLIRSHETRRSGGRDKLMIGGVTLAVIAGLAVLAYVETRPVPALVNHAVETAPATAPSGG